PEHRRDGTPQGRVRARASVLLVTQASCSSGVMHPSWGSRPAKYLRRPGRSRGDLPVTVGRRANPPGGGEHLDEFARDATGAGGRRGGFAGGGTGAGGLPGGGKPSCRGRRGGKVRRAEVDGGCGPPRLPVWGARHPP